MNDEQKEKTQDQRVKNKEDQEESKDAEEKGKEKQIDETKMTN